MPTSSQLDTARKSLQANLQALKSSDPLAYETTILSLLSIIADNAGGGGGGYLYVDFADTVAADDGGSIYITASNHRVKRVFDSASQPNIRAWGTKGNNA